MERVGQAQTYARRAPCDLLEFNELGGQRRRRPESAAEPAAPRTEPARVRARRRPLVARSSGDPRRGRIVVRALEYNPLLQIRSAPYPTQSKLEIRCRARGRRRPTLGQLRGEVPRDNWFTLGQERTSRRERREGHPRQKSGPSSSSLARPFRSMSESVSSASVKCWMLSAASRICAERSPAPADALGAACEISNRVGRSLGARKESLLSVHLGQHRVQVADGSPYPGIVSRASPESLGMSACLSELWSAARSYPACASDCAACRGRFSSSTVVRR